MQQGRAGSINDNLKEVRFPIEVPNISVRPKLVFKTETETETETEFRFLSQFGPKPKPKPKLPFMIIP